MDFQGIALNGQDLSFSDLVKVLQGNPVKPDADLLKLLPNPSSPLQDYEVSPSPVYLSIILNALLKSPESLSSPVIDSLSSLLPSHSPAVVQITDYELRFLSQDSYKFCSELVQSVHNLSVIIPLLDGAIGLSLEAENTDSSIADEDLYPNTSQGLRTTVSNLQSLLHDSKLAKKAAPSEGIIEIIQISGVLKDLVEESEKNIEQEVNAGVAQLKKTCIKRSTASLLKVFTELLSVATGVAAFVAAELPAVHLSPSLRRFTDLHSALQSFQVYTSELLSSTSQFLRRKFTQLSEFEEKINQGANKHRPLQLGKGSRSLYQLLKESSPSDRDLSQFILALLASKNEERRVPKIAKGMRDYASEEMVIREHVFTVIRSVFKKHMAAELDTPVMELRETLTGKYGDEGSKLIYNIADQGGELLSLRYDLTVPFARYVAMNRITNWKRYQIGKVYRRDQPQMKKGRYREFYQCDFDIVGVGSAMSQDAEVLKIITEILHQLDFNFVVKINHRKLLDSFLDIAGCPSDKFRTVASSIDKLDKEPWAKVRSELVNEKGIAEQCADLIGEYVKLNGHPPAVLATLMGMEQLTSHKLASKALQELANLVGFCESLGIVHFLNLDMSLARGLDYYTGLVYEAVTVDGSVGSIAGGGRYDELIMRLNNSNQPTPAVGVSLGVERLFTIMEERYKAAKTAASGEGGSLDAVIRNKEKGVLVAQAGNSERFNLMQERYKLCNALWSRGISAETSYKEKSDPKGQAGYASQQGIKWIVWVGETELAEGKVKIKDLTSHSEELIPVEAVADFISSH